MKRIVSVFRCLGQEVQSYYPIGSPEFDADVDILMNAYISFENAQRTVVPSEPFSPPKFNSDAVLNCEEGAVGVLPINVIWFIPSEENPEQGKVVHSIPAFIGRAEVEVEPIKFTLVK